MFRYFAATVKNLGTFLATIDIEFCKRVAASTLVHAIDIESFETFSEGSSVTLLSDFISFLAERCLTVHLVDLFHCQPILQFVIFTFCDVIYFSDSFIPLTLKITHKNLVQTVQKLEIIQLNSQQRGRVSVKGENMSDFINRLNAESFINTPHG